MTITILDYKSIGEGLEFDELARLGTLEIYDYTTDEEIVERLKNSKILVTNKAAMTEEVLEKLPNLRCICITGTGYNNVDIEACRHLDIAVCNVTDYSTDSVTQHTFAMLLYMVNQMAYYDRYTSSGDYVEDEMFSHYERSYPALKGMVMGIIGLGTIGRQVATVAQAFGIKVIYYSASGKNHQPDFIQVSLEELLKMSDIISIHAPLNEYTRGLLNETNIGLCKKEAYLLNLGRGGIVTEEAIVKALDENLLRAIGIDVLEGEPMAKDCLLVPYLEDERLLITPHVAWANQATRQRVVDEVVLNVKSFLIGQRRHRVD